MNQITVLSKDGVSIWCVNGMSFPTMEEAEKAEQEILDYYAEGGHYYGD